MKKIELNKNQKEKIWSELNLSGSKFKSWCLDPEEFVKNKEKDFNDFLLEKMDVGNKIEDFIFNLGFEKYKNEFQFIKDKKTYSKENEISFCYANIDGFLINKSTNEKWILEIKNTEIDNVEELAEIYKYQILYYCWFFGLTKAKLLVLINGWKLRSFDFDFTDQQINFCEKKIEEFKNYLKNGKIPETSFQPIQTDLDIKKITLLLAEEYPKLKELEKSVKVAEEKIKNYLISNNLTNYSNEKIIVSLKVNSGRKSIDKENLEMFLNQYDKSISDFEKEGKESYTLKKDLINE